MGTYKVGEERAYVLAVVKGIMGKGKWADAQEGTGRECMAWKGVREAGRRRMVGGNGEEGSREVDRSRYNEKCPVPHAKGQAFLSPFLPFAARLLFLFRRFSFRFLSSFFFSFLLLFSFSFLFLFHFLFLFAFSFYRKHR